MQEYQDKAVKSAKIPLPKALPEDVEAVVKRWPSIVSNAQQPMKTYLKEAKLSLGGDNKLMIVLEDGLSSDYLTKNQENKEQLTRMISEAVQKEIEINIQSIGSDREFEDSYIDLSKIIHMEIEVDNE